jgi:hypothetical protein
MEDKGPDDKVITLMTTSGTNRFPHVCPHECGIKPWIKLRIDFFLTIT